MGRNRGSTKLLLIVAALLLGAALPALALAHIERPSYWPDPRPDKSIKPAAGGKVPKARSLASALRSKPPGSTRVVCQKSSLPALKRSIRKARTSGYDIRPSDHRRLSKKQARRLLRINRALYKRCRFHEIQPAVTKSRNNDRVVVMPGLYEEPTSRAQPLGLLGGEPAVIGRPDVVAVLARVGDRGVQQP